MTGLARTLVLAAVLSVGAVTACTGSGDRSATVTGLVAHAGASGAFVVRPSGALHDRPVHVLYRMPLRPATARILVVMPGRERDASRYRSEWEAALGRRNVILLVPRFDDADYPGVEGYNLGNVVDDSGAVHPRSEWIFPVVEQIVREVRRRTANPHDRYLLYGHSAGAQFVHRMMELYPHNHVATAVAANAGWYTRLDDSQDFPYGLHGIPVDESDMGPTFASRLVVLLGADDIDEDDPALRRDEQSDKQGTTRLERGLSFYLASRRTAEEHDFTFRWRLVVTPGVAHEDAGMSRAAVPLLFGPRG